MREFPNMISTGKTDEIKKLTEIGGGNCDTLFEALTANMMARQFLANNPALTACQKASDATIAVAEWAGLVAYIVQYLSTAKHLLRYHLPIAMELARNIAEERGSRTGGVSHQDILTQSLKAERGISLHEHPWSDWTIGFLHSIDVLISRRGRAFVAGIIFALEASATPELLLVKRFLEFLPKIGSGDVLEKFVDSHVDDFEPSHRDNFAQVTAPYLADGTLDWTEFARGFLVTCDLMDTWWTGIAEVMQHQN